MLSLFNTRFPKEFPKELGVVPPHYIQLDTGTTVRIDRNRTPECIQAVLAPQLGRGEFLVILNGKTRFSATHDTSLLAAEYYRQEADWLGEPYQLIIIADMNNIALDFCHNPNVNLFTYYIIRQFEIAEALKHNGRFSHQKQKVIDNMLSQANTKLASRPEFPQRLKEQNVKPLDVFQGIKELITELLQPINDSYGIDCPYFQTLKEPLFFMRNGEVQCLGIIKNPPIEILSSLHSMRKVTRHLFMELCYYSMLPLLPLKVKAEFKTDLLFDVDQFTPVPAIHPDLLTLIEGYRNSIANHQPEHKFILDMLFAGSLTLLPSQEQLESWIKERQDKHEANPKATPAEELIKAFADRIMLAVKNCLLQEPEIKAHEKYRRRQVNLQEVSKVLRLGDIEEVTIQDIPWNKYLNEDNTYTLRRCMLDEAGIISMDEKTKNEELQRLRAFYASLYEGIDVNIIEAPALNQIDESLDPAKPPKIKQAFILELQNLTPEIINSLVDAAEPPVHLPSP